MIPYRVFLSLRVMRLFLRRKDGAERRLPPCNLDVLFPTSFSDVSSDTAGVKTAGIVAASILSVFTVTVFVSPVSSCLMVTVKIGISIINYENK